MPVPHEKSYNPPLDQFLRSDEPRRHGTKVKYSALGLGREHVPELIRMATDEALHSGPAGSGLYWAPVHAWWALAELRAEEAIGPLLGLLRRVDDEQDDWVGEDIPRVLAEIGAASLPPVTEYLTDSAHGEWARVAAIRTIELIGKRHPVTRGQCIARLSAQLQQFAVQSETLNAFLISALVDLGATEAASVMEEAFASGRVDEMVQGDWEDVQIDLGLKVSRERPRKPNPLTELGDKIRNAWATRAADPAQIPSAIPDETPSPLVARKKVGRNDPCPCGSGAKFKKCCGK